MRAEAHTANMEVALLGAASGVKIAGAALNMTIGAELEEPVNIDEDFSLPEIGEIDNLERAVRRALANRIEMISARGAVTIADSTLRYFSNCFSTYSYEYTSAELNLEEVRLRLQAAEEGIRFEVFTLHQKLSGMEKQLVARQKSLDLAAESYRLSKMRYELGVATQGEVADAILAFSEQEINLLNEKFDYYIDYMNWRLKTGLQIN